MFLAIRRRTHIQPTAVGEPLKAGWTEQVNPSDGSTYYWHGATQASTYVRPIYTDKERARRCGGYSRWLGDTHYVDPATVRKVEELITQRVCHARRLDPTPITTAQSRQTAPPPRIFSHAIRFLDSCRLCSSINAWFSHGFMAP